MLASGTRGKVVMEFSGGMMRAWAVGWAVCMIAIVTTDYDGIMTVIFGTIVAVIVGGFVAGAASLSGLILRIPPLAGFWRGRRSLAIAAVIACLAVMAFGSSVGLSDLYVDPVSGRRFVGLHPAAVLSSYFLLLFVVANWPAGRPTTMASGDPT